MPKSTHLYPFENKVLGFAVALAERMTGLDRANGFLMYLSREGAVQSVTFDDHTPEWRLRVEAASEDDRPHLYFDPFDAPDYSYLSWNQIAQHTMERLIGQGIESVDLVRWPHFSHRTSHQPDPSSYPSRWSVMF
jgi:hypothetical protein